MSAGVKADREVTQSARFRPVIPEDAERLSAFYAMLHEQTRAIFKSYRFNREHAEEIARESVNRLSGSYHVAVVDEGEHGETIIGLVWFWDWRKKVPWIGIMITDAHQNRGLGTRMMEYAVAEAKSRDKGGILLTTAKTNVRGQALYKRFGFEMIGEGAGGEYLMILNFSERIGFESKS